MWFKGISKNLDGESKNYFALAKNWWHVDKISPITLYNQNRSLSGFNLHNLLFNQSFNTRPFFLNIYAKLFSLYEENKIKPLIDSVYSFEKVIYIFLHYLHYVRFNDFTWYFILWLLFSFQRFMWPWVNCRIEKTLARFYSSRI